MVKSGCDTSDERRYIGGEPDRRWREVRDMVVALLGPRGFLLTIRNPIQLDVTVHGDVLGEKEGKYSPRPAVVECRNDFSCSCEF